MDTSNLRNVTSLDVHSKNAITVCYPRGRVLYSYGTPVALQIYNNPSIAVKVPRISETTQKHITGYAHLNSAEVSEAGFIRYLRLLFKKA